MARKILHVDLDAFFCAVEEKFDPSLKGKAFATGGSPQGRGVVTSCSYAARRKGIRSAMPMVQALRKCPDLIAVRGHYGEYTRFSRQVMERCKQLTPLVEQISIDEAFLDVTDLPQPAEEIAAELQMKIWSETGLPCSIGVASNKLMAKIATNIGKSSHREPTPPMAILNIPPGAEKEFLAPLPISEMWGIGPKSEKRFNQLGILTIGDILKIPFATLQQNFGKFAQELVQRAQGKDDRLVGDYEGIKSVSNEVTFFDDVEDKRMLLRTIKGLAEKVGARLRTKGLMGKTVRVKLRWPSFETITRQTSLPQPTNQDSVIYQTSVKLFMREWEPGKKIRLIGVGVAQICEQTQQLSLFDHTFEKEKKLLDALDDLHRRYGEKAIHKGVGRKNQRTWKEE